MEEIFLGRKMKHNVNEKKIVELYESGLSGVKIADKLNIKNHQVYYILDKHKTKVRCNSENSRTYKVNHNYFESIDTPEKAYWLGFIAADGFVVSSRNQVGISLGRKDKNHLEKLVKTLSSNYKVHDYISTTSYKKNTKYSRLMVNSKKMKSDLISHGIVKNKTFKLKYPTHLTSNLNSHYIRGYLDGDGSITRTLSSSKLQYDYQIKLTGTKTLLKGILSQLGLPNYKLSERYYDEKDNYYFSIGGNIQVLKLLDYIYKDSTVHLERKYQRYLDLKTQSSEGVIPENITL